MILLTDGEINAIRLVWCGDSTSMETRLYSDLIVMSAKAQLKKVVEWGNEFCDNHWEAQKRHKCSECWQALLKEVEGE